MSSTELEIEHAWISHHVRMFYLNALETLVSDNLGRPLDPSESTVQHEETGKTVLVADIRLTPVQVAFETIDDVLTGTNVFRMTPFSGSRFQALADGCRDDSSVQLACSVSMLGQYIVAAMGKYLLPRDEVEVRGDGLQVDRIALLTGYVEVVALDFVDFDSDDYSDFE